MLPVEDLRRVRGANGKAALSQVCYDRSTSEIKCELSDEHDVIAVIPERSGHAADSSVPEGLCQPRK